MNRRVALRWLTVLWAAFLLRPAACQELLVTASKPTAIYAVREPIAWSIELRGTTAQQVHYMCWTNRLGNEGLTLDML